MVKEKNYEAKAILIVSLFIFALFLAFPIGRLILQSISSENGLTWSNYMQMLSKKGLGIALRNSVVISAISSLGTTVLAFLMAYSIHYTNLPKSYKKGIRYFVILPMLLPTITYGFAIIYSFGKQGIITKIMGKQLFDIYGIYGLLIGYGIYTLPISFMLIHNTMGYIDKKYSIVSGVMGDSKFTTFMRTVLRPLVGTLAVSLIQCFFLCFTDFGIPASVGGRVEVIATVLYNQMLGSVPNFSNGAVVAMFMLLPSLISISILRKLEKYNVRYNKISIVEIQRNRIRDSVLGTITFISMAAILVLFAVIVVVPFMKGWPYDKTVTLDNFKSVFRDSTLLSIYGNSIKVALLTAIAGTVLAFGAALVTARSMISPKAKALLEAIAAVTNTIPGMVLGIAFMLVFSGTSLQNTFVLIIICNMIHFFATPYMMGKNTLSKMNLSWEKTAKLMGDSWFQTLVRVIVPNAANTILEIFEYYFINAMVTVSAVIFLAGARTMVITTKIKELQHFAKFNEVFVLSLLILGTNLMAKFLTGSFVRINQKRKNKEKLG